MKAILEFELPEEEEEHQTAFNGAHWKGVCFEMDQYLRGKIKYAHDDTNQELIKTLKMVRLELNSLIEGRGLTLY